MKTLEITISNRTATVLMVVGTVLIFAVVAYALYFGQVARLGSVGY